MTDLQTLHQYTTRRDPDAFRLLVENYQCLVYSAARRRLDRPQDIEDAVQTTFLKLARAGGTIRRDLAAWLYTTTLNTANEMIRANAARRRREARVALPESTPAPSDFEESSRLIQLVDSALLELPPDQQSLIIEHYLRGRSQRDLAAELSVSQPTILRRLDAAVAALRQRLATHGTALAALPTALLQLHSPVPPALTAQLAKIGLAAPAAKTVPLFALTSAAKAALTAATLLLIAGAGYVLMRPAPPTPTPIATPAPSTASSAPATSDLSPTELPYTKVTVNFDNLSAAMATQTFSEQAAFSVRLTQEFPAPPPFSLHLRDAAYFDALFQFAALTGGHVAPHSADAAYALVGTGSHRPAGQYATSGPLAAYLGGPGVDLLDLVPGATLTLQFLVEPQNTSYILFPDDLHADIFTDASSRPIRIGPRSPVPGVSFNGTNRSLTLPLTLPDGPTFGTPDIRISRLKGVAPFRLVTRTQTLTTAAPTDHATQPFGNAAVEFFPLTTRPGGPFDIYTNFECRVIFHRNKLDAAAWQLFITHLTQSRFTIIDSSGESLPAYASSSTYPTDHQSVDITFTTSANEKKTSPQSARIVIPTDSRRILFPFDFQDFPLKLQ